MHCFNIFRPCWQQLIFCKCLKSKRHAVISSNLNFIPRTASASGRSQTSMPVKILLTTPNSTFSNTLRSCLEFFDSKIFKNFEWKSWIYVALAEKLWRTTSSWICRCRKWRNCFQTTDCWFSRKSRYVVARSRSKKMRTSFRRFLLARRWSCFCRS